MRAKEYLSWVRSRYLIQIGLIASLLWLPLPSAQAHAELVSANPAVDAHLDSLPSQVSVTFDRDLLVLGGSRTNKLTVMDSQGIRIDAKDSKVSGATMTVGLNPVNQLGTFTVSWRVVSGDGHPEASSYQFTVGAIVVSPHPAPLKKMVSQDFWTRYSTRLMLLFAAAVAVGIWVRFERASRKRG